MTVIAAYTTPDTAWMGSDTQLQDDGGIITSHLNKVSLLSTKQANNGKRRQFLIGGAGCARIGYMLDGWDRQYPSATSKDDVGSWIKKLTEFIVIKMTENETLWKMVSQHDNELLDGSILVAIPGHVWEIAPDFMAVHLSDPYGAIGSGEQLAIGAFMMADYIGQRRRVPLSGEERVEVAIRAAIKHLDTCGGEVPITKLTA